MLFLRGVFSGEYDQTPAQFGAEMKKFAESGLVNIVGGCCGTSPGHIKAAADALEGMPPRIPQKPYVCNSVR